MIKKRKGLRIMENNLDLMDYMEGAMKRLVANVIKSVLRNPQEAAFLLKYQKSLKIAYDTRNRYKKLNQHIPSFLIASIADTCNLTCKGCYARANGICNSAGKDDKLSPDNWQSVFYQAKEIGIPFILLAGGEPLMEREIIQKAAEVKEIAFPIFTNGTLFDKEYIELFHKNRNLIPIFSVEGSEKMTAARRGEGVYDTILQSMETMKEKGMLFGNSITITTENIEEVTSDSFLNKIEDYGCHLIFYVEYVPIDENTTYLSLTEEDRSKLENKLNQLRVKHEKLLFLSFPGDEEKMGGCLAAGRGFFHISPTGNAEPCPFSPYSKLNVKNATLLEIIQSPFFKKVQEIDRNKCQKHQGGCVLFENRDEVEKLMQTPE